jgi:6-pyruvoyltetrahydropterin/6-carboxytetrahydropterin synthase
MSYTIFKTFRFEAAHHLTGLPDGHQCGRVHGHSYRVTVILESAGLVIPGFVADFGDLKPVKQWVDATLDHQDLNAVLGPWWVRAGLDEDTAPTSEHLAELIYTAVRYLIPDLSPGVTSSLAAVRISETETSCAEFRP